MLEFLYAFCILITELQKIIRFLTITVRHGPLGQASYPLARILFFLTKKELRFLVITVLHHLLKASGLCPCLNYCMLFAFLSANSRNTYVCCHHRLIRLGKRATHLLGFLYAFPIPIDELMTKLWFLATAVLHPP